MGSAVHFWENYEQSGHYMQYMNDHQVIETRVNNDSTDAKVKEKLQKTLLAIEQRMAAKLPYIKLIIEA